MKLKLLATLLVSLCLSRISYGLTWTAGTTTIPIIFLDDNPSTGNPNTYSSSLNLATNGFVPGSMNVTSATITFWFADDGSDGSEQVDLFVNGNDGAHQVANDMEVDGTIGSIATYASYSFNLNSAAQLAALQDGIVDFKVNLVIGDTYLKIVSITANGNPSNIPGVPDGGATAAMLGLGFIGLVAARKRLAFNA